ncbi:MAG: NUDIX hydrolase [Patescibacteria group bacterium]
MNTISHDSETPADGQQVITVCGFIHHNFDGIEKVFLPKRAETKKFLPGVYELPGGHVDFGETTVAALKREISEELGMSVEVGDILYEFSYVNEIKKSHSIEVIYFAKFIEAIGEVQIHPEDHSEYGWFAENELANAATAQKGLDDQEFIAIQKGFDLLRGEPIRF